MLSVHAMVALDSGSSGTLVGVCRLKQSRIPYTIVTCTYRRLFPDFSREAAFLLETGWERDCETRTQSAVDVPLFCCMSVSQHRSAQSRVSRAKCYFQLRERDHHCVTLLFQVY